MSHYDLPEISSKTKGIAVSKTKMKHDMQPNPSNQHLKSSIRKKSPKKSTKKKSAKSTKKKSLTSPKTCKEEWDAKSWKPKSEVSTQMQCAEISDSLSEEVISSVTLDPDVLRWDHKCEDIAEEVRRIEVYKANRRLRYINARTTKLALLAIKERK